MPTTVPGTCPRGRGSRAPLRIAPVIRLAPRPHGQSQFAAVLSRHGLEVVEGAHRVGHDWTHSTPLVSPMSGSCQSPERGPAIRKANRHQRRLDDIVGAKLGSSRARSATILHTFAAARRGPGHAVAENGKALT